MLYEIEGGDGLETVGRVGDRLKYQVRHLVVESVCFLQGANIYAAEVPARVGITWEPATAKVQVAVTVFSQVFQAGLLLLPAGRVTGPASFGAI
jgi:hypothetical protein